MKQKFKSLIFFLMIYLIIQGIISVEGLLSNSSNSTILLNFNENEIYKESLKNDNIINDFKCMEINQEELNNINRVKPDKILLQIKYKEGSEIKYQLQKKEVLGNKFTIRLASGRKVEYNKPIFYSGVVIDEDSLRICLTIHNNYLTAIIMMHNGNIMLSRAKKMPLNNIYLMYNDNDYKTRDNFTCATIDDMYQNQLTSIKTSREQITQILDCIDIGIFFECDYNMYQYFNNSATAVSDYVSDIFNVVQDLYLAEEVNVFISEIFVWDSDDGYDNSTLLTLLQDFSSTRTIFNGHYAQLLSFGSPYSSGIAWLLSSACSGNDLSSNYGRHSYAGISSDYEEYPTYSRTVKVITHELGHQFGSRHTHWCGWPDGPIDNCAPVDDGPCDEGPTPDKGTIMSYCDHTGQPGVDFNLGFGQLPGDVIRETVFDSRYCLATLYMQNETENNPTETVYEAPINIWAGYNVTTSKPVGNYIVNYTDNDNYGNVVFKAGYEITLRNGFQALKGSKFTATIDNNLSCFGIPPIIENVGEIEENFADNNINSFSKDCLQIFPSPAYESLNVRYLGNQDERRYLVLYNNLGCIIAKMVVKNRTGLNSEKINLVDLPSGMYFLTLKSASPFGSGQAVTKQFAVVR